MAKLIGEYGSILGQRVKKVDIIDFKTMVRPSLPLLHKTHNRPTFPANERKKCLLFRKKIKIE